ncbi:MAG TPA: hypothetical protein VK550_05430, partial [Polyangiaceae bacterium]|nr:hypothetical protein [Polyangiaceae bacterium]
VAQPEGPHWADERWERLLSADRALTLGVPDDDAVASVAMCATPEMLVAVTVAGRLLVDGDTIDSRSGRFLPAALTAAKKGPPLIALTNEGSAAVLWAADRIGRLARSVDGGRTWSPTVDIRKSILALAIGADRSVVVLAAHDGQSEVLTSVDGGQWTAKSALVDGRPLQVDIASTPWLAAGASCLAIGDANGVWIARHGEDFRRVAASTNAQTIGLFTGTGPDASLVFAESGADIEEATRLFRCTLDGRVEILAELTPPEDDRADAPAVLAMAWDEIAQSLRVAFSTMLSTVAPRAKA